jgi:hypothetical protein
MLRAAARGLFVRLAAHRPAVRTARLARLGWAAAGGLLFVALFAGPAFTAGDDTDPSWAQLLCLLQRRGVQHGVDLVYPYGPLHLLLLRPFDPALFEWKFWSEVLFKAATAAALVRLARRLPAAGGLTLLAVAAGFGLALSLTQEVVTIACLAVALRPVLAGRLTPTDAILAPTYLAAVGLAKFTFVGLGVAELAVLSAYLVATGRRGQALVPWAVYAVAAVPLAWLGGQLPWNLLAYYRGGAEYAAAYADGLTLIGPKLDLRVALLAAGVTLAAVLTAGRAALLRPRPLAGLALVGLAAGLGWKLGFVRHDGHALIAFAVGLVLPTLVGAVLADAPGDDARRGLLRAAAVLAAAGGFEVVARDPAFRATVAHSLADEWQARLGDLLDRGRLRDRLAAEADALRRKHDLPAVRAAVGDRPIDVLTEAQGVALLNGLNLAPRPTLQSVNATSAAMLRRNADYYAGPAAPPFLLLKWQAVDGRYPTLADGPALLEAVRRYRPVLTEKGHLLLARRPEPLPWDEPRTVLDADAATNDAVALPPAADGELRTLQVDVGYTALGGLRSAAFRPPYVRLIVRDRAGAWHPYRLVPAMAAAEFPLDPLFADVADLAGLWDGRPGERVTALKVFVENPDRRFVRDRVRVTVRSYPRPGG